MGPPPVRPAPGAGPPPLPARVAAIASQLEITSEASLVNTINIAWGVLFGGPPAPGDGLVQMVSTLEEALHGSPTRQMPPAMLPAKPKLEPPASPRSVPLGPNGL